MIMKKLVAILTLAFIAAVPARVHAQINIENDPAYLAIDKALDLKTIKPEVNINLPKFLLKDVLSDLNGGKDDPLAGTGINLSELIQDVKLIRVVVIEGKKNHGDGLDKGMATLRATLEKGWTPITVVNDGNDKVGVYAIGDPSGNAVGGLAVLVHEKGGDAVIANIVGHVSIGKLVKAASQMNKFPKDLLQKLTAAAGGGSAGGEVDSNKPKEKPVETTK